MSRINHLIETGVAVSLPLAAIGPAITAVTLTSRRAVRDPSPRRSRSPYRTMTSSEAFGAVGRIAMLAAGGGLFAVRMRRDHLDPVTR
jgi:hypothetical protein